MLERQYTSFFLPVNEKTILLSKKCFFCNPLPHLVLHVLDEVGPLPLVRSYHSDLVSDDAALDEPETELGRTNLGINRKSGDFSWAHNSPKGWDWFSQLLFLKASLPCSTLLFLKKLKKNVVTLWPKLDLLHTLWPASLRSMPPPCWGKRSQSQPFPPEIIIKKKIITL